MEPTAQWPIPLAGVPDHTGPMRLRRAGAVIAAVFWLLMALALGGILLFEWEGTRSETDLACPAPGVDSVYGPSTWQWWPPGAVCHWDGRRTTAPGSVRAAWTVAVVLGGVALLAAVPALVRSSSEHSGGC